VSLGPDPLPLPRNVPVGHNCDEDQVHWVRLQCAHVAFELSFVVRGHTPHEEHDAGGG
jgi:hypothetical protein